MSTSSASVLFSTISLLYRPHLLKTQYVFKNQMLLKEGAERRLRIFASLTVHIDATS